MDIRNDTLLPFDHRGHPRPEYQVEVIELLQERSAKGYALVTIDAVRVSFNVPANDGQGKIAEFREARMFFFQKNDPDE